MEGKIERVDLKNLKGQMEKEIKEKGGYAEVHVLVGDGETHSIPHVEIKNADAQTVAGLLAVLESVIEDIETNFPVAAFLKNMIRMENGQVQSFDKEGNEINNGGN